MVWPKGKKMSEETKAKMSATHKALNFHHTPENVEKIRQTHTGRIVSQETRAKMSVAQSKARSGKALSDRQKKAIGDANRKSPVFAASRIIARQKSTGKKRTVESRRKLSEARTGITVSDEGKAKLSASRKNFWANLTPEQRETRLLNWRVFQPINTSIEVSVKEVLESLAVDFNQQFRVGRYWADFYLPAYNVVLECDGDYWHNLPKQIERDKRRDAFMLGKGFIVRRILGSAIKKDTLQAVTEALDGII